VEIEEGAGLMARQSNGANAENRVDRLEKFLANPCGPVFAGGAAALPFFA